MNSPNVRSSSRPRPEHASSCRPAAGSSRRARFAQRLEAVGQRVARADARAKRTCALAVEPVDARRRWSPRSMRHDVVEAHEAAARCDGT